MSKEYIIISDDDDVSPEPHNSTEHNRVSLHRLLKEIQACSPEEYTVKDLNRWLDCVLLSQASLDVETSGNDAIQLSSVNTTSLEVEATKEVATSKTFRGLENIAGAYRRAKNEINC